MDFLKPTAEHIASYIRFWIGFVYRPAAPLKEYENSGVVQPQLIVFLGISILVSWFLGHAASGLGMPDDPSWTFRTARDIAYADIPEAALIATFATVLVSAVAHGLARFWIAADRRLSRTPAAEPAQDAGDGHLGGNVYDTVNGALGFIAFFAPLCVAALASALLATRSAGDQIPVLASAFFTAAVVVVYLPASVAATHRRTSYTGAVFSLSGGIVSTFGVVELLGWALRWI